MLGRALARSSRTQLPLRNNQHLNLLWQSRHYARSHQPSRPPPPRSQNNLNQSQTSPSSQTNRAKPTVQPIQASDGNTNVSSFEARFQNIDREINEDLDSRHNQASSSTSPLTNQSQSSQPLPDLTQGIPSTIDAELDGSKSSGPLALGLAEDPEPTEGRGRETPKSTYVPSLERKKRRVARIFLSVAIGGGVGAAIWYGRNWDTLEEEKRHPEAPSGWGIDLFYKRIRARTSLTLDHYTKPAFEKLLPDMQPEFERPYTLVVGLEDLLVHGGWSREHGWRVAKRPGVDYFLRYLSSYYEIVIWSTTSMSFAQPVLLKLDPYRVATWPLFKEATRYENGECIKDISYLNRDPSKVIVLDTNPAATQEQPENAIIIPKWEGDPAKHKDLVALIPFLEYCATMNFDDLRKVLKSFEGKKIPEEYARREAVFREKYQQKMAEEVKKRSKPALGGIFSALTGPPQSKMVDADGKPIPTMADAIAQGKTYSDLVRERGRMQYEFINKQLEENGEKMIQQAMEEDKRLQEEGMREYSKSLSSWIPFFGSKGSPEATNDRDKDGK